MIASKARAKARLEEMEREAAEEDDKADMDEKKDAQEDKDGGKGGGNKLKTREIHWAH